MLVCFSAAALADGPVDDDVLQKMLGKSGKATIRPVKDDILRLTSNKDRIIRLDQDAASVIVNNPAHASVVLDSPRLLIVMPRAPGATSFSVLNAAGDVILHKNIVVTNVEKKYVRVRRICGAGTDASCVPTAYFYCPDGCYEVTPVENTGGGAVPPPVAQPGPKESDNDDSQLKAPQNPIHATDTPAVPGLSQ